MNIGHRFFIILIFLPGVMYSLELPPGAELFEQQLYGQSVIHWRREEFYSAELSKERIAAILLSYAKLGDWSSAVGYLEWLDLEKGEQISEEMMDLFWLPVLAGINKNEILRKKAYSLSLQAENQGVHLVAEKIYMKILLEANELIPQFSDTMKKPDIAWWLALFIPGAGHIYAGQYFNGISTFLLTGGSFVLLASSLIFGRYEQALFLDINLAARFVEGNLYQSKRAVQQYNQKVLIPHFKNSVLPFGPWQNRYFSGFLLSEY